MKIGDREMYYLSQLIPLFLITAFLIYLTYNGILREEDGVEIYGFLFLSLVFLASLAEVGYGYIREHKIDEGESWNGIKGIEMRGGFISLAGFLTGIVGLFFFPLTHEKSLLYISLLLIIIFPIGLIAIISRNKRRKI